MAHWAKAWDEEPKPKWVHKFYHTLDVIQMNWYLEMELRHGTIDWYDMKKTFVISFSFEDGLQCIYDVIHEIKVVFFITMKEPTTWVQLDWNL